MTKRRRRICANRLSSGLATTRARRLSGRGRSRVHQVDRLDPERFRQLADGGRSRFETAFELHNRLTTQASQCCQLVLGERLAFADGSQTREFDHRYKGTGLKHAGRTPGRRVIDTICTLTVKYRCV
jgi:hypothetical protein